MRPDHRVAFPLALVVVTAPLLASVPVGTAADDPCLEICTYLVPSRAADGHLVPVTVYVDDAYNGTLAPSPTLLWGHGWAGNRGGTTNGDGLFFRAHGYNVVAIDQRGHGAARATSAATVMQPELEGKDLQGLIDWIATQPWAQLDVDAEDRPVPGDPVLGALGGSYGGGYQLLISIVDDRLDAMAPDITWNDLPQALAPNGADRLADPFQTTGAVKSAWVDLLYAGGKANANVAPIIDQSFAWAMATNDFPDGSLAQVGEPDIGSMFRAASAKTYSADPTKLDTPALLTQGIPDTLFNLNQAYANYKEFSARPGVDVRLVTHLGGHILSTQGTLPVPSPVPVGLQPPAGPSPCGNLRDMRLAWYDEKLKGIAGADDAIPRFGVALDDATCIATDDAGYFEAPLTLALAGAGPIAVPQGVPGASVRLGLFTATAPTVVAGIPHASGKITLAGADGIVYFSLVSLTPDGAAKVLDSQVTPLRRAGPLVDEPFDIDLGGIGTRLQTGDSILLVVASVNEQFATNGERAPGAVVLSELSIGLPVR